MTYAEKLLDPKWKQKRDRILLRDNFTCVSCGRKDLPLQVHHIFYSPNTDPWNYIDAHLVTYCETCHETEHLIGDKINEGLIDVIRERHLFIQPVAQLSILIEKYPPFLESLRLFLRTQLVSYLESRKNDTIG